MPIIQEGIVTYTIYKQNYQEIMERGNLPIRVQVGMTPSTMITYLKREIEHEYEKQDRFWGDKRYNIVIDNVSWLVMQ